MDNYEIKDTLYITRCCTCGICFGIPDHFDNALRKSGKSFYCPNGHSLEYKAGKTLTEWHDTAKSQEKDLKELKTQLARKTHQLEQLQARLNDVQVSKSDTSINRLTQELEIESDAENERDKLSDNKQESE